MFTRPFPFHSQTEFYLGVHPPESTSQPQVISQRRVSLLANTPNTTNVYTFSRLDLHNITAPRPLCLQCGARRGREMVSLGLGTFLPLNYIYISRPLTGEGRPRVWTMARCKHRRLHQPRKAPRVTRQWFPPLKTCFRYELGFSSCLCVWELIMVSIFPVYFVYYLYKKSFQSCRIMILKPTQEFLDI